MENANLVGGEGDGRMVEELNIKYEIPRKILNILRNIAGTFILPLDDDGLISVRY